MLKTFFERASRKIESKIQSNPLAIRYRTENINIYHCCAHKTGSQWMQSLLGSPKLYQYSGLSLYSPNLEERQMIGGYNPRSIEEKSSIQFLPRKSIIGSLHINFDNFLSISKPNSYKAFFVNRDPRDILISYYFSARESHVLMGNLAKVRKILNDLTIEEGLLYSIDYLYQYGLFSALDSWIGASQQDDNTLVVKFEDLTSPNNIDIFKKLFQHCDICIPDAVLIKLLHDYSFKSLSGRAKGQEDKASHLRKGISGDWKNYFNEKVQQKFQAATGDLVTRLGYQ